MCTLDMEDKGNPLRTFYSTSVFPKNMDVQCSDTFLSWAKLLDTVLKHT